MSQQMQAPRKLSRAYYTGMAVVFVVIVFIGFSRTYYLKSLFGTPNLSRFARIHGAVFTAWTIFFVCQTALVAAGRTDLHRRIGAAGAVLAAGIVSLGTLMAFYSVRAGYASGRPNMASLLLNAMIDLVLFSLFLVCGLLLRHKKEMHKRLMMLAMLSLIIPAIGRLPMPSGMIGWAILAFSLTGIVYDAIFLRRLYFANVVGALLINLSTPLRFIIGDSRAWQNLSEWLVR